MLCIAPRTRFDLLDRSAFQRRTVIVHLRKPVLPANKILVIFAFLTVTSLFFRTTAGAQVIMQTQPAMGAQTGRFMEAPRSMLQQLREAKRALQDEQYSDAVVRLGDLLSGDARLQEDDLAGQDFLLDIDDHGKQDQPITTSLLRSVRDQIGSLPAAARETYRLRYAALAKKMLDDAARTRDWYQVREVRRRYFHTDAGYEASALLAQHEMYSGHPLAASILLDDIVTSPAAIEHLGAGVVVLHAAACRHAGRELPSLQSIAGQLVTIGNESVVPPASAEQLQQWLIERTSDTTTFSIGINEDYPVFGTSPDRNGGSAGQMPLTNKRWDLVTTASPRQERDIRAAADAMIAGGKLPPPSWIPIRVGNHLLMRTTERLVGVDYRTGKRVWTYPWQTASEELDQDEQSLDALASESELGELLRQRVWNDNPYGQITSDGQRVFMIDSLQKVELMPFGGINMAGTRPADGRSNTLVSLDLETEGKLLWRLGAGVDDGTDLSAAFFLGPPLPLDGRLYVIAELSGDISLFCLDPAKGNEIWRQQLVAVESGGIETDAVRRVSGAIPSYDQGILICPTGAGAIVAVDLGDRMIRWGMVYNRNVGINRAMIARGRNWDDGKLMQRWYSGAAIIADNTVLVTPIESDRLYGLDLMTGQLRFPPQNRVQLRYLAGARDGKFFVVGPNQIRAFDLKTGQSVWNSDSSLTSAGQSVSGIGVFGDGEYLLPTSTNEIVRVSLADGSVLGRRQTGYSLGNLVAAGGEIISQGPTKLSVAFGEQSLEPLVDQMLKRDPNNLDALIRKSELLIQRGDRADAIQLLDRAREMDKENDEIRMLNVAAMLGQLREAPQSDPELIEKLDAQIERPVQRIEFLSLLVRAALGNKDSLTAVERLVDLSSLLQANPLLEPSVQEISDETGRQCSLNVWIAARLADTHATASQGQRQKINQRLSEFSDSKQHGSTSYLEQMVRQFGPWEGVESMRKELQQRLRDDGALLKLERLALGQNAPTDAVLSNISNDRLMSLASTYADGLMWKDALAVLSVVQQRGDDADMERVSEIRAIAETEIVSPEWPKAAELNWESRQSPIRTIAYQQRISATSNQAGKQFQGWTLVSDAANTFGLRDPTGFVRRIPTEQNQQVESSDRQAQISGGFMVIMTTDRIIGVDLFRMLSGNGDAVLWNRPFDGQSTGPFARRRMLTTPFDDQLVRYYLSAGTVQSPPELQLGPMVGERVFLLQGGDLLAIDLLTSSTLWRNSNAPKNGVLLSDGQRLAVVSPDSERTDFFDLVDGRKLGSEKWIHQQVWETSGTNVLTYQDAPNRETTIKLVDPFKGEVLLQHQSVGANRTQSDMPCAYANVVERNHLVMLSSDGDAMIWDLREGREISTAKLTAYPDLQGLETLLMKDQILLLPRRRYEPSRKPEAEILQTRTGSNHKMIHGLHAISLSDGQLLWHRDFDKPWGCTMNQPSETPLLMLSRGIQNQLIGSVRRSIEVLALDVRDGNELHPAMLRPVRANTGELETRLTIQPSAFSVIVNIGPEVLTYTFGNQPN